jgi:hypothetical protein
MRRQYVLAALALIALLAAAPSWNDTTCDRTTPLPAGWTESPSPDGASQRAMADWNAVRIPLN